MTQDIVIAIIGVIAALSPGFWKWLERKSKKLTVSQKMDLAIGRDRLNYLCKEHLKNGYIPEDEIESFKDIGECYIAMGGNSRVKRLYEDAMKLPLRYDD